MSDPATIALTDAQKAALAWFNPVNDAVMGVYDSLPDALIERVGINHPIFGQHIRLSKAGLKFRAQLLKDQSQ